MRLQLEIHYFELFYLIFIKTKETRFNLKIDGMFIPLDDSVRWLNFLLETSGRECACAKSRFSLYIYMYDMMQKTPASAQL